MSAVNAIFSALGNNSSLWSIATKDGIETVGRTAMAYKEGSKTSKKFGKLEAREKLIEANATSLVWLGGIPLLKVLFDKFYTNKKYGFAQFKEYGMDALAKTDVRLLNADSPQALNAGNIKNEALKGHVEKILKDKNAFKMNFAKRAMLSTLIPIALVGYILPKTVYAFTHRMIAKEKKEALKKAYSNQQAQKENIINSTPAFATFMGKANRTNLSFHGGTLFERVSKYFTHPNTNMVMVDGGILAGRAGSSRNWKEAGERTIYEAGYIGILYWGGNVVSKGLNWVTKKLAGIPTALDAKLLQDKKFTDSMLSLAKDKNIAHEALNLADTSERGIITLIDNDLARNGGKFSNVTLKAAQDLGFIHIVNGERNPLKYIETKEVVSLNKQLKEFVGALAENKNAEKLISKVKFLKRSSVVANIAICSAALAIGLPKLQYFFRSKVSDNTVAPGLAQYYDNNSQKA